MGQYYIDILRSGDERFMRGGVDVERGFNSKSRWVRLALAWSFPPEFLCLKPPINPTALCLFGRFHFHSCSHFWFFLIGFAHIRFGPAGCSVDYSLMDESGTRPNGAVWLTLECRGTAPPLAMVLRKRPSEVVNATCLTKSKLRCFDTTKDHFNSVDGHEVFRSDDNFSIFIQTLSREPRAIIVSLLKIQSNLDINISSKPTFLIIFQGMFTVEDAYLRGYT